MTGDHTPMPQHPPTPEQIRCAADGEASPVDAAATAAGAAASGVRFEQDLRTAIGRVMGEGRAPDGLADRIRAAMAAAPDSDSIHLDDVREGLIETGPVASATSTDGFESVPAAAAAAASANAETSRFSFTRWMEAPRRANAAAVAAVIALVIGAIGFGIVMPTISEWGQAPGARFVEQAATFAANEHGRCSSAETQASKLTEFSDAGEARAFLARHLNRPVEGIRIPDLTDRGYEFVGVAACHVPGGLPSAHAVWRSIEPMDNGYHAMVSGFVTLDRDQFELQEAMAADIRVSGVNLPDGSTCSRTVRVVREGGLAFMIVCCEETSLDDCTRLVARGFGR